VIGTRSKKHIKQYKHHMSELIIGACQFCDHKVTDNSFVTETKSFKIIRNIFPYKTWDLQDVNDHLLIIPKKHTDTLNDFTANEAIEYVALLGSYESRGYNVYSRSPGSGMKSVVHQHTHLIKTNGKTKRVIIYTKNIHARLIV